eukprot:TRINITY_DN23470_c0_g1_i1.p2 TRINITY_DN23470_c0_g1~~TRINITY_DN23470_c0_g1_i1.p2  ORF type:complete len:239 (-),score=51.88 TRINITY_DN23470_c0_g1_i1:381-1097(-)
MLGIETKVAEKKVRPPSRGNSDAVPPKKGRTGEDAPEVKDDDMGEGMAPIVEKLVSLSLSNAHQIAVLRAVSLDNMLLPRSCSLINEVKAVTKDYHDKAIEASKSKRQMEHPPHVLVWQKFMEWFATSSSGKGDQPLTEAINTLKEEITNKENVALYIADIVRHVRISKTHRKDMARVEVGIKPNANGSKAQETWTLMQVHLLKHYKAEARQGMAPKTDTVRKLEKQLKTNEEDRHNW